MLYSGLLDQMFETISIHIVYSSVSLVQDFKMKNFERVLVVVLFVFSMFCLFLVKANASGVKIRPMQSSIDEFFG